jgi:energy-coupling factor transporter ATP-binding protein EcfA2
MNGTGDAAEPLVIEEAGGQLAIFVEGDKNESEAILFSPPPFTDVRPPRLRRVWFENFKSFERFEVTLGTFNVIAGANNAGKSTLLQGVDLLHSLLKLHADGPRLVPTGRLVPTAIVPVATMRDLFFRRVWRTGNVPVQCKVGAEFFDGAYVEVALRHLFGNLNSQITQQSGMTDARLEALLAHPSVWVPSASGIVRDEEYRPPARQRGLISAGRHNEVLRNLLVEIKAAQPDRFDALQAILTARFGAGLGDVAFDATLDQFVTGTYRSGGGVEHDLYSAGSGFVQLLQMLAFVFARSPGVILLDEPDAHLHSSLQRVVVEILDELSKKEGMQVLLATHSKEIINFVDPTRLILLESGEDKAGLVSAEVTPIAVLKSLGDIDNVDAYALVKNRRCLFLEGTSDAVIFGRFAAILGIHAFTGDGRVVTVPVGGADRFEHVQQLDVLEAVLGAPLQTLEVRDRDGRIDDHVTRIVEQSSRPLHMLALDCIESYLIHATVLCRVISDIMDERGKTGPRPTVDEVEALVSGAQIELRQPAEDRIAERVTKDAFILDNERLAVPKANELARQFVAANWNSPADRLRVVPGKRLLGAVRSAVQNTYGVNFGNERLAEAFTAAEIPHELVECIHRAASL